MDAPDLAQLLAADPGAGGVAALLAEHPNPTVRLLADWWSKREAAAALEAAEEEADAALAAAADEPAPPPDPDPALRRELRRLHAELARLQAVNDTLAAALGACDLCWGEDPGCEVCAGEGGPGSLRPDPALFRRIVLPALRRVRPAPERAPGLAGARPAALLDRAAGPAATLATATTLERREG